MAGKRYEVEYDEVTKWIIEQIAEDIGNFETDPVKCTITDRETGDSESAVGDGDDDAMKKACGKMGISTNDLDEEIEEE